MRLEKFESEGLEPIGEGEQKKAFINPDDESRIISEVKEETEIQKDTPRQLKGRYYLTKIAHLLLPKNIPDIYQAGESVDGKQVVDTERISHTPEHAHLQDVRKSGGDEEMAGEQVVEEMGKEMRELDEKLEDIGLGFNIDENIGNYTKSETGDVYYLETFKPWEFNPDNPKDFEVLFDEEAMREFILGISDQSVKEKCTQYLDRLLVLLGEEKQELQEHNETSRIECGPHVEELEAMFTPFMSENFLTTLHNIETREEAFGSEERKSANKALAPILSQLKVLINETNITDEKYNELYEKFKIINRSVGTINRGIVDHSR